MGVQVYAVCVIVSLEAPNTEFYHCVLGAEALNLYFNFLKIICRFMISRKQIKFFEQKCYFQYLKFVSKFSTLSLNYLLPQKNYYKVSVGEIEKLEEASF